MCEQCPFRVGDTVAFINRSKKAGLPGFMGLPHVGEHVQISALEDGPFGTYVKWVGIESYPGGALHWTEFSTI